MAQITFEGSTYTAQNNESVLDCLLKHGVEIPFSCKSGSCQSCMMQFDNTEWIPEAQKNLKPTLREQGMFLACSCYPNGNISIKKPSLGKTTITAQVCEIRSLSPTITKLCVVLNSPLSFRAGQFVSLIKDNLSRSYSIANLPNQNNTLEFHIKTVPNGQFSQWVHTSAKVGDTLLVRGPAGNCFYMSLNAKNNPIILAACSTGLAPLYGILQDALAQNHKGAITLLHCGNSPDDIYLKEELHQLQSNRSNFSYRPYPGNTTTTPDSLYNDMLLGINSYLDTPAQTQAFICGNPKFVAFIKKNLFLQGLSFANIYSDAFIQKNYTSAKPAL